jgi:putative sterol carrier protein
MTPLCYALQNFSVRVNGHSHLRTLARKWQTSLYVQSLDSSECFHLVLNEGQIVQIEPSEPPTHDTLLLRGETQVLESIFSGDLHPLSAFNEGNLEMYGPQADQIKLDAISLLIWGA